MTSEIAAMLDELMGRGRNEEAGKQADRGIAHKYDSSVNFLIQYRIKIRKYVIIMSVVSVLTSYL